MQSATPIKLESSAPGVQKVDIYVIGFQLHSVDIEEMFN